MSGGGWEEFARALSAELASLPLHAIAIILERGRPERFAQFAQGSDHLRAEVAGDTVDGRTGLLTARDERLLEAAGWRPPAPGDHDRNWWRLLPWPATSAEHAELAGAVVTALRDVQGVAAPADLVYRSWEPGGRRRALRLPGVTPDEGYSPEAPASG